MDEVRPDPNLNLSQRLLVWYEHEKRQLPWRGQTDAYGTWVSEIMLQQTRVETVIPFFLRWMQRFPTIHTLAAADEQEVLKLWEGLGYYSRARSLHRAARLIVEHRGGKIPTDRMGLEQLPGIGPYTAGAIASIAFGQDEAALDGNIRRVLARAFAVRLPIRSPQGEKRLWELARQNLPPGRAGDYNQALMDLGATICTPRGPNCLLCPLVDGCRAYQLGIQDELPIVAPRKTIPHHTVASAVLHQDGRVLIARRPANELLGGLWEFPGGTVEAGEELEQTLQREIMEELGTEVAVEEPFGIYNHAYTHYRVTLHAFLCRLAGPEPQPLEASELRWAMPEELGNFPMGKIDRQIANRLQKDQGSYAG